MKKFSLLFTSVFSIFFATSVFASGVLVDAKGSVTVTAPDGKSVPGKTGIELPNGSKVTVGKNAIASVMLMDGSIQEIGEGQKYTVGSTSKPSGKRTVIDGVALAMNEATSSGQGPTVHGMVKMTQLGPGAPQPTVLIAGSFGPQGIYPSETAIELPSKNLTFKWKTTDKISFPNPVIVVETSDKRKILTRSIVPSKSEISIDINDLRLAPGASYSWYLASKVNGKTMGKSGHFNFRIISGAEKRKLSDDKSRINSLNLTQDGKDFLIAQLYFKSKMYDSAVTTLLPLWEKDHQNAVKRVLYLSYIKMGLRQEAVNLK